MGSKDPDSTLRSATCRAFLGKSPDLWKLYFPNLKIETMTPEGEVWKTKELTLMTTMSGLWFIIIIPFKLYNLQKPPRDAARGH